MSYVTLHKSHRGSQRATSSPPPSLSLFFPEADPGDVSFILCPPNRPSASCFLVPAPASSGRWEEKHHPSSGVALGLVRGQSHKGVTGVQCDAAPQGTGIWHLKRLNNISFQAANPPWLSLSLFCIRCQRTPSRRFITGTKAPTSLSSNLLSHQIVVSLPSDLSVAETANCVMFPSKWPLFPTLKPLSRA